MTETRLQEILYPLAFKGAGKVNTEDALNAMKQAVNEAIQECADVLTGMGSVERGLDMAFKHHKEINRKRILKLKVK